MLTVAAVERRWPPSSAPWLHGQRSLSRRPQTGRRLDAADVVEVHRPQADPEGGVDVVTGIGQHDARRDSGLDARRI